MNPFQSLSFLTLASLCAASPVSDFFRAHQMQKRSVGYCTFNSNFDTSQFEPIVLVGNPNGAPSFCESEWMGNYKPVEQINLWWNDDHLLGIQAIYTDSVNSPVYGTTINAPSHAVIGVNYGAGHRWTQWTEWYNEQGDGQLSAFTIAANNGQSLHVGYSMDRISSLGLQKQDQNVGAGYLFGFEGQAGNDGSTGVTRLGALFISSPVQSIEVSNVHFPQGPGTAVSDIEVLAQAHQYNAQDKGTLNWSYMNSHSQMTTRTFTSTSTFTYGGTVAFSFSGGFLFIAQASNTDTFTFSTMQTSTNTITDTETTTVTWSDSGTLQPGEGIDFQAIVGHGTGTFSYDSTVTVTLQSGFQFSYPESGSFKIDDISTAVVSVTQANHP